MTVLTVSCYYIFARMVRLIAICTDKSKNTYPELFNMQIVFFGMYLMCIKCLFMISNVDTVWESA